MTTDDVSRVLTWDAWNRLVEVADSVVDTMVAYEHDALGRRIEITVNNDPATDLFYSSNWQVVEERVSGTTKVRYIWSPVYVDAMVLRDRDADGNSGNGLEQRLYVTHDANWNITALINTSGSVVERYVQDPYGRFDVKDASWGALSNSAYAWIYVHQGGRWDAAAGLYHFRHRDYSPTLMRWASVDPIGFRARDVNLNRYEGNSPLIWVDPRGLQIPREWPNLPANPPANPWPLPPIRVPGFVPPGSQLPPDMPVVPWNPLTPLLPLPPVLWPGGPGWYPLPEPPIYRPPPVLRPGWSGCPNCPGSIPPNPFDEGCTYCGQVVIRCKKGVFSWPVYANCKFAGVGNNGSGCKTLAPPLVISPRIICTGSCKGIKGMEARPGLPILRHEACHACDYEDSGMMTYLAGAVCDDCNDRPRPADPSW
jgi:RHS repeat-associated protein